MNNSVKSIFITFLIGCVVFVMGNIVSDGFDFESVNIFFIEFGLYQLYTFVIAYTNTYFFNYMEG